LKLNPQIFQTIIGDIVDRKITQEKFAIHLSTRISWSRETRIRRMSQRSPQWYSHEIEMMMKKIVEERN
jgi:hypothetical protein